MKPHLNRKTTLFFIAVSLSLSSCELISPPIAAKLPLVPLAPGQHEDSNEDVYKNFINKPLEANAKPKSELFPGTDRFISGGTAQSLSKKSGAGGSYSLNFDEADLGEVAKVILGDILGQNYVLSPKVAGKVTLQTTQALTKEELLPTLEMVLRMNNAALVRDGRIYHIEPVADALFTSKFSSPSNAGYQTRVFPIRYVAVQDVVEALKPLLHDKTILHSDGSRNILVASGTADEMSRVANLISTFDIDILRGRSFGIFPLSHVEPETMIKELEEIFNSKGKSEDSEFFRFIAVERMNAVMAITHQAGYLKDIENWIFRLDRANTASGGGVNVYRAQHVDAEELASTLNEIFTGASSTRKEKAAKVSPGQNAAEVSNKQPTQKQNVKKKSSSGGTGSTGDAHVSNVDNVRIIADIANNSIVIVATPQEYEVILPIIKQLDVLPLQVLIDATIVSVTLTDALKYGIQWFLDHGDSSVSSGNGQATLGSIAKATAGAFATGGLAAVYNSGVVNALLSAQASIGNLNVISSPSLMVLNNQQAKINVGDQVPIQTSSSALPTTAGTTTSVLQTNSIQYLDTGVTLEVTPRVNASGMVIMEIKQVVSTPTATTTGVTTTPTIQKKEIESFVAVQDGETIVLGGLIDNNNRKNNGGIPWLHQLPLIGPLFGNTDFLNTKNELVVLITPRVVKSKLDSRIISDEFKRKLTGIYQETPVYISKPAAK